MTRAHRLNDLAKQGPFGRTKLFDLIGRGVLPARKIDGTTFVLEDDWRALLEGAPLAGLARHEGSQARSPKAA